MKLAVICSTMAVLSGCGGGSTGTSSNMLLSEPSLAATTQMVPSVLPLTTFASGCRTSQGFRWTTAFDLVVVHPSRQMDVSVDHVTFRLITGESVGGPMITYPRPQLAGMFGTTAVARKRVFRFQLEFDCHVPRPRSIAADVILIDRAGDRHRIEATAGFE